MQAPIERSKTLGFLTKWAAAFCSVARVCSGRAGYTCVSWDPAGGPLPPYRLKSEKFFCPLPFLETRTLASSPLGWEAAACEPTAFEP